MPSTLIKQFSYNTEQQILTIQFVAGPTYNYLNVPPELFYQMKNAFAKGIFFNKYIKGKFPFEKMNSNG